MSAFSWLAAPAADAAIGIGPGAVTAATLGSRGGRPAVQAYAVEPIAAGVVTPALTTRNVVDRPAMVAALRTAVERLGTRVARVALLVPDLVARVSLVRFERVPAGRDDLDQLIRWQVRKSAPFPIEEAQVAYTPGTRSGDAGEFLVLLARREVVREYESVCEEAGLQPGLVDLSTLGLVDLLLGAGTAAAGDWLLVHMRPECTSLAILRGPDVIFFRTRGEGEGESLADLVHQTTMYYQDRLAGRGFARVLLGGAGHGPGALAAARASLETRLGTTIEFVDPAASVALPDRGGSRAEHVAALAPAIGVLLRSRAMVGA